MKVSYDVRTDSLSVVLRLVAPVAESDEEKPGIVLDYDAAEILSRSRSLTLHGV
jgi:hypothetical protein